MSASQRLLHLTVLITIPSAACADPLEVMSFNLRFDAQAGKVSDAANAWVSSSGVHRRDLALQVVEECDPDILGVQEALTNQMVDLRKLLNAYDDYGIGRDDGVQRGEYCGIFYRRDRFRRVDAGTFWLNADTDTPGSKYPETCCARIASWIVLRDKLTDGAEYLIVNTHWDHQVQAARLFSAKLLRERIAKTAPRLPVVLLGDLNAAADNPAFRLLYAGGKGEGPLEDSFREVHTAQQSAEGTYHGFQGKHDGQRIDYILHSNHFRVTEARIIRTQRNGRYPSDHFPVTATLVPSIDE